MVVVTLADLGSQGLSSIIERALHFYGDPAHYSVLSGHGARLLGTVFMGVQSVEPMVVGATAGRAGLAVTDLTPTPLPTLSSDELLMHITMASSVTDVLLTSIVDRQTFAAGRRLTERFSGAAAGHIVSIADDVYANQAALAHLLAVQQSLGRVAGTKIAVTWTFGTRAVLPTTAHSLVVAAALLGASVRVVSPKGFPLSGRAVRGARQAGHVELYHDFGAGLDGVDVVVAENWCRLEDFLHPERGTAHARQYRDWYISPEVLPGDAVLLMEPPVELGLSVSASALESSGRLHDWLQLRCAVLAATLEYVLLVGGDHPVVFV